jgi:hypothetical protein
MMRMFRARLARRIALLEHMRAPFRRIRPEEIEAEVARAIKADRLQRRRRGSRG